MEREKHKEQILGIIDNLNLEKKKGLKDSEKQAVKEAVRELWIAYLTENRLLERNSIISAMRYLSII